jgi:hypothetical protein
MLRPGALPACAGRNEHEAHPIRSDDKQPRSTDGHPDLARGRPVLGNHLLERKLHAKHAPFEVHAAASRAPGLLIQTEFHPTPAHKPGALVHVDRHPCVIVQVFEDRSGGSLDLPLALGVVRKVRLLAHLRAQRRVRTRAACKCARLGLACVGVHDTN